MDSSGQSGPRPHRRRNALTGEWVLVSPQRTERPWQGQVEKGAGAERPRYDPGCYLCPGNLRAGGERNPDYRSTLVFINDYPALLEAAGEPPAGDAAGLLRAEAARGTCRVICFSPRHDLTLAEMTRPEIGTVVELWAAQTEELGRDHRWVQVFENKGALMGCSNPHPHGQIWAVDALPTEPAHEDAAQRQYLQEHGRVLLVEYAARESKLGERVVVENEEWVAVVPWWATWPFELLLVPRRPVRRLPELDPAARASLPDALGRLLARYDNLFQVSFPYSMGWHGAPYGAGGATSGGEHWQLHAHFYPPLLRSATIRKFMVGYEMLSEAQRDLTPEQAAARLRELPELHYREASPQHEPA